MELRTLHTAEEIESRSDHIVVFESKRARSLAIGADVQVLSSDGCVFIGTVVENGDGFGVWVELR